MTTEQKEDKSIFFYTFSSYRNFALSTHSSFTAEKRRIPLRPNIKKKALGKLLFTIELLYIGPLSIPNAFFLTPKNYKMWTSPFCSQRFNCILIYYLIDNYYCRYGFI